MASSESDCEEAAEALSASAADGAGDDDDNEDDDENIEDDDSDDDGGGGDATSNWRLTGLLFGNIDSYGELQSDDVLDNAHLAALSRLGLDRQLSDVITAADMNSSQAETASGSETRSPHTAGDTFSHADNAAFSAESVDYSDITELADDESVCSQASDHLDCEDYDLSESRDSQLMPPPSTHAGLSRTTTEPAVEPDNTDNNSTSTGSAVTTVARALHTPLAAMLPPAYADVDITQLFPDFRQDRVLRFSRLFRAGKSNMLPQPWRCVKKRHRPPPAPVTAAPSPSATRRDRTHYDSDDEQAQGQFKLKFGPVLPADQVEQDDEERLLQCEDSSGDQQQHQQHSSSAEWSRDGGGSGSPKTTDWRQGPSQLWYDMLDWRADGLSWDYGFKEAALGVCSSDDAVSQNESRSDAIFFKERTGPVRDKMPNVPLFPNTGIKTETVRDEAEYKERCSSPPPAEAEEGEVDSTPLWRSDKLDDGAFLLVSQLKWEDDVIWNGDDIKHKVCQKLSSKSHVAGGWLPSGFNRTAAQSVNHNTSASATAVVGGGSTSKPYQAYLGTQHRSRTTCWADEQKNSWFSIFPVENEELVSGRWEDDVIFDPFNMSKMPHPRILTLDPNDENIILGIPDDVDPAVTKGQACEQRKIKIPHPHVRKSKVLLGKAGVISHLDEDTPPPTPEPTDRDPFNISNDEFYMTKTSENSIKIGSASGLLQHSIPVVELMAPFVPTYQGPIRLRQFHRPLMKRFSNGPLATTQPVAVLPLLKHIRRKAKQREQERLLSGGGEVFFMRCAEDLTGRDGDIILVEYCEEHPPCLSLVGMCSKVKNYYKRRAGKDPGPPELQFGESAIAHTSPFLGVMQPGRCIQTIENNMYRSPVYPHRVPVTDFLLIRTRQGYSVREWDSLFVAGQQCPLYEVPGPNSKRANNFTRDFLQVFIYRLFWKSYDHPRRIKMEVIKRAFPHHSESSIRKRLKPCADFKRTGVDSNWWVIKPEFRLPTEDEIRAMVSPEQCCGHFSMTAAEQRLKDAGYGERFLLTQGDDDDVDLKIDDEIKMAPWNTTRAYIQAAKGKCLLQLTGVGDPTGCGEGFSYIRVPNKPTMNKEEQSSQPKRIVTGTDADLRRLPLANAKALLKNFGVPDEEIKKLSRWEVIDVVRTLSTEKAKAGEEGMDRFSRGNRFSIAEHQERYKEDCQRLFDLQNRVLASDEVLSTDEGSSTEEENDEDIEEHGKNIENMLSNKKTSSQLSLEKEEKERQELRKIMMAESPLSPCQSGKKDKRKKLDDIDDGESRVLRITRTFRNSDGGSYSRVEIVRKPAVIEAYLRIRNTKDDVFIKQFAGQLDDVQKEEMKREKRRIQEQLRRIKRNQERERLGLVQQPRSRKPKLKPDLNIKCGACGQVGHMRTNKACPRYQGMSGGAGAAYSGHTPSLGQILAETEDTPAVKLELPDNDPLVNVDGTKIKLSGKVMKHAEELKRKSMMSGGCMDGSGRDSPSSGGRRKRRRACSEEQFDYLQQRQKTANRRRIDPVITFSTMLESILNEMRDMPDVQPFLFPVNVKTVPDYYNIVQQPMDLQTIRENLRNKKYQSREEFLSDVNQIVDNSSLYNGTKSVLTLTAQKMRNHLIDRFAEKEEKFMKLEKAINPLLDDDDQVGLSYILDRIINECVKTMQESWPFLRPVSRKMVKDYYDVIKSPIDIEMIEKKVKGHKYHCSADFVAEFALLLNNCVVYNGRESSYTQKAQALLDAVKSTIDKYTDDLCVLEANIAAAQQRAIDNADTESVDTGSVMMDDETARDREDREAATPGGHLLEDDLVYSDDEGDEDGGVRVSGAINVGDVEEADEHMLLDLRTAASDTAEDGEDVDPSYDPEAFLYGLHSSSKSHTTVGGSRIHSDLQISESEGEEVSEDESGVSVAKMAQNRLDDENDDDDEDLCF